MYISIDLDDTLLNKDGLISDYNLNILKKCQENGHKIVINTARNYMATIDYFDLLNADFAVLNAGSLVINKNKEVIYKKLISFNDTKTLLIIFLINAIFLVYKAIMYYILIKF